MKRILVIEDDKSVGLAYKRILQSAGYDVVVAPDGETGTRVYSGSPTDLVIADVVLPVKGGLETIQDLTRDFPDVKIIAVSGGGVIGLYCFLLAAKRLGGCRETPCVDIVVLLSQTLVAAMVPMSLTYLAF